MKVHIFELRRMKWKHDWSSQLYTQLKQLRNSCITAMINHAFKTRHDNTRKNCRCDIYVPALFLCHSFLTACPPFYRSFNIYLFVLIWIWSWCSLLLLCYRYGDRTPKSDAAKAFAMIWFLVGLVMFGLFSGAVTSALTVVVANGGPAAESEKLQNVSITPLQL